MVFLFDSACPPSHFQWAWGLLNSNFFAALFGALAGALGAHYIAKYSERRRQLLDEITAVNRAIQLATSITNIFASLKKDQIKPLVDAYLREFMEFARILNTPHPPPPAPPAQYSLTSDFRSFDVPQTSINELRQTILNHIQFSTQSIGIVIPLHQSIEAFLHAASRRMEIIGSLKQLPANPRIDYYFGLPMSNGNLDETYPDLILGISTHTDSAIYFSMLLAEILTAHGSQLAKQYGRGAPTILKTDYSSLEGTGLLPDRNEFPDFEKIYRDPKKDKTRSQMRFWFWKRRV